MCNKIFTNAKEKEVMEFINSITSSLINLFSYFIVIYEYIIELL